MILTRRQLDALRDVANGEPFATAVSRKGGARRRMFDRLKDDGYVTPSITPELAELCTYLLQHSGARSILRMHATERIGLPSRFPGIHKIKLEGLGALRTKLRPNRSLVYYLTDLGRAALARVSPSLPDVVSREGRVSDFKTDAPQQPDTKPGHYYVSVCRDNGDAALLAGPFVNDHAAALAHVDAARRLATESGDPRAPFYSYGTLRTEPTCSKLGCFNRPLGIVANIDPFS